MYVEFKTLGMRYVLGIVKSAPLIGASLSDPHTRVTALRDACVCMYVCMYVRYDHIPNI